MPHNFSFSGACLGETQLERAVGQELEYLLATQAAERCSPHLCLWGACLVENSILLSVLYLELLTVPPSSISGQAAIFI